MPTAPPNPPYSHQIQQVQEQADRIQEIAADAVKKAQEQERLNAELAAEARRRAAESSQRR